MSIKTYDIKVPYEKAYINYNDLAPKLTAMTIDVSWEIGNKKRPAVIICPGGGYEFVSDREAEPVATRFTAFGIHAFVLRYSVVNKQFPTALLELSAAVSFVRANAEQWDIDPDNIGVCGFSAGGHLAASLGVHWNKDFICEPLGLTDEHRPNFMVLAYPVITSGEYRHDGSIKNLLCDTPSSAKRINPEILSLEKQVSPNTPRTFIWHCADDGCVPVENTIDFTRALSSHKIPFESHIYPYGGHGISLCDDTTSAYQYQSIPKCAEWFDLAIKWIKEK